MTRAQDVSRLLGKHYVRSTTYPNGRIKGLQECSEGFHVFQDTPSTVRVEYWPRSTDRTPLQSHAEVMVALYADTLRSRYEVSVRLAGLSSGVTVHGRRS